MKFKMKTKLGKSISKAIVKARVHAPAICLVGGIIASAGAMVFAVKAGMDTPSILEERKSKVREYKKAVDEDQYDEPYTEEDCEDDIKRENAIAVGRLAKTYAPAVALYALSVVLMINGHKCLNKRIAVLANTLTATNSAWTAYRKRVASYVGDEEEEEIYKGKKKVKKTTVDEETGEVKEETVEVYEPKTCVYSRCFDETCPDWQKDAFRNRIFVEENQRYFNDILKFRGAGHNETGFVFLNEVYKALGFPQIPEGQYIGWWYKKGEHEPTIDFGILNSDDPKVRLFMNGYERSCWLNFNIDGDIMHYMKKNGIKEFQRYD